MTRVVMIKYLHIANPLLYELELAFTAQWTPPLDVRLTSDGLRSTLAKYVGSSTLNPEACRAIRQFRIVAHYPTDDADDKEFSSATGLQWLGWSKQPLFTWTTRVPIHAPSKSTTCGLPLYRVWLSWWAMHPHTGYVEVNVSKHGGLEHPMWVVAPKRMHYGRMHVEYTNELFLAFFWQAGDLLTQLYSPAKRVSAEAELGLDPVIV